MERKSTYQPHTKSFSTGEGLWKGRINNLISHLMWRGAGGEVFLALKSTFKPHPKSFSTGEGHWKGKINNLPSHVERGRGWGFLSLKSTYQPHTKSFSTEEGLSKGRIYIVKRVIQIQALRTKIENLRRFLLHIGTPNRLRPILKVHLLWYLIITGMVALKMLILYKSSITDAD
jgi:hypothetical protein